MQVPWGTSFNPCFGFSLNFIHFRCYPKCDGTLFTYETSGALAKLAVQDLVKDLKSKVESFNFSMNISQKKRNIWQRILVKASNQIKMLVFANQSGDKLLFQTDCAEKLLSKQSSMSYPYLEGTMLSRFVGVFIQSGWEVACRWKIIGIIFETYRCQHNLWAY